LPGKRVEQPVFGRAGLLVQAELHLTVDMGRVRLDHLDGDRGRAFEVVLGQVIQSAVVDHDQIGRQGVVVEADDKIAAVCLSQAGAAKEGMQSPKQDVPGAAMLPVTSGPAGGVWGRVPPFPPAPPLLRRGGLMAG